MISSIAELILSTLVSLVMFSCFYSLKNNGNIVKLHALPSTIIISTGINEAVEAHLQQPNYDRESCHGDGG